MALQQLGCLVITWLMNSQELANQNDLCEIQSAESVQEDRRVSEKACSPFFSCVQGRCPSLLVNPADFLPVTFAEDMANFLRGARRFA